MVKVFWSYEDHCYYPTTGEILSPEAEIPAELWERYLRAVQEKVDLDDKIGSYRND